MPEELTLEPGYFGPLTSLGGIVRNDGRGRQLKQGYVTATVAGVLIMEANSRRIAALVENQGGNNVNVFLGAPNYYAVTLRPGASLQIDTELPWTGSIAVLAPAGDSQVNYVEISVP